jgi:hypothetical protein
VGAGQGLAAGRRLAVRDVERDRGVGIERQVGLRRRRTAGDPAPGAAEHVAESGHPDSLPAPDDDR